MVICRYLKLISANGLSTTFLTWFFMLTNQKPKPLRAATALIETPVAIASGISYYLNLGISVYDSLAAIIISNLTASIFIVILGYKIIKWYNSVLNKKMKKGKVSLP